MNTTIIITISAAIVVVALFVLGLSITLIRKGHNIEGDVGNNRHMRAKGLECASAEIRRQEAERLGIDPNVGGCDTNCTSCPTTDSDSEQCLKK